MPKKRKTLALVVASAPVANDAQAAPPTDPQPVGWIDEATLAERTTIKRDTWQTWRRRGIGPPYYKVGRRCLYKWNEVQAWLESKRTEPKAS